MEGAWEAEEGVWPGGGGGGGGEAEERERGQSGVRGRLGGEEEVEREGEEKCE